MPALPLSERITNDLFTTLQGITRENGYTETLEPFKESKLGNNPGDVTGHENVYTALVIGPTVPDENAPLGKDQWWITYWTQCYAVEPDENSNAHDQRNARIFADVNKAVCIDYTRGGLAIDTRVTMADPMSLNLPDFRGVIVQIQVWHRTAVDDPYNL